MTVAAAAAAAPPRAAVASTPEPSIRALIQANLALQAALLPQLLSHAAALSAPSSSAASARTQAALARAYAQLADADAELARLTERARRHAARWQRLEQLKRECVAVEGEVRRRGLRLERGRRELEKLVAEAGETKRAIKLTQDRPLPPSELLSYAALLAQYTSAPPSFDPATHPHQAAPGARAFFPPFPTEAHMRRGRLNNGDSMGVVGQTSEVNADVPSHAPEEDAHAQHLLHHHHQQQQHPAFAQTLAPPRPQPTAEVFDFDLNSDLED